MTTIIKLDDAMDEIDARAAAASSTTALTTAVTAPPSTRFVHPLDLYLEREPGGGGFLIDGEFITINGQTGAWARGSNKEPISATTPFLVNLNGMAIGRVKLVDNEIVDREIGLVAEGYERKARAKLGDCDERRWPIDKRTNKRVDPWKPTTWLPMRCMEDDKLVVFGPLAPTQLEAIKRFVSVCRRTDRGGKDPLINLVSESFPIRHGGVTYKPVFKIIGWEYWEPGVPAPQPRPIAVPIASPSPPATPRKRGAVDDMDDEIPF